MAQVPPIAAFAPPESFEGLLVKVGQPIDDGHARCRGENPNPRRRVLGERSTSPGAANAVRSR